MNPSDLNDFCNAFEIFRPNLGRLNVQIVAEMPRSDFAYLLYKLVQRYGEGSISAAANDSDGRCTEFTYRGVTCRPVDR